MVFLFLCCVSLPALAVDAISIQADQISIDGQVLDKVQIDVQLPDNSQQIKLQVVSSFQGLPLQFNAALDRERWHLDTKLNAHQFTKIYSRLLSTKPTWQYTGMLDLSVDANYADAGNLNAKFRIRGANINGEYAAIGLASEAVDFLVTGNIASRGESVRGGIKVDFNSGLIAYGDLLIEPTLGAMRYKSRFNYSFGKLSIRNGKFVDPGGFQVEIAKADIDPGTGKISRAEVRLKSSDLSHLYSAWLQPLFYDTAFEDIEINGQLDTAVVIRDGKPWSVDAKLVDINVADKREHFSLYGLNGRYNGTDQLKRGKLSLAYENAVLHRLSIGGSKLNFLIDDYNARLAEGISIPLYGGALKIFELSFDAIDSDALVVKFDGVLMPIDLSTLTHDLGWQAFSGSLSGVIPGVQYKDGALSVDGILLAKAFDGSFRIKRLGIANFIGAVPVLSTDLEIEGIDLEKLTQTFDFGRIEGKLSGHVKKLRMSAWQPESFNAYFYTPENDTSRHVISQRAVDNLTSLSGSDISSILSRSYLSFLENFRYKKLGIGCHLNNGVCRMRGIEAAQSGGYYIVKSGFFPPRLDIIGYSLDVDWLDLLSRLKRVLSDNAPVIR